MEKQGRIYFADSPPNAVISAVNLKPQVVVVQMMGNDGDHLYFKLKSVNTLKSKSLSQITFTVDGPCGSCASSCKVNGSGYWCSFCYNMANTGDNKTLYEALEQYYPVCAKEYGDCVKNSACDVVQCANKIGGCGN